MTNKEFIDNYQNILVIYEYGETTRMRKQYTYVFELKGTDRLLLDAGGPQGSQAIEVKIDNDRFIWCKQDGTFEDVGKIIIQEGHKQITNSPGIVLSMEPTNAQSS